MLPKHIFLSYAREDLGRAKPFVSAFERAGWSVWWDQQVLPGDQFRVAIAQALNISRCVVVLWSRQSSQSGWVADEAETAKNRKALIPVLIDDVDPPLGLRGLEHARLVDWNGEADHPELTRLLEAIARRAGPPSTSSQALADAYFTEQREIIRDHAERFVGRTAAQLALTDFMNRYDRGYFIVRGGPGQGKTALASRLVQEHGYVHHFASRGSYRADPKLAVRSLLSQLTTEHAKALPQDLPGLTRALTDSLGAHALRNGRSVMLFDALDEAAWRPDRDDVFLPVSAVPRGTYIVVTTRPGESLDYFLERLATVPNAVYDLSPLDRDEVVSIVRREAPALTDLESNRILTTVVGNPLFLRAVLNDLDNFRGLTEGELPRTIEAYFRRTTRALEDANKHQELREILSLLVTARRPLTLQELSAITGTSQRELHDLLQRLRPLLSDLDRHYSLFHPAFGDFLRRSFLFSDEIVRTHGRIAAWLMRPDGARDYQVHSLAYHLYHAGAHQDLAARIDATFLKRKARETGWDVLEDIELMSRSYLETGDAKQFSDIVDRVHLIHKSLGPEIMRRTEKLMRGVRSFSAPSELVDAPQVSSFRDLDVFVANLPRHGVSADFVELCPVDDRLFLIIGDVPGAGIEAVFAARFLANLAAKTLRTSTDGDLATALGTIRRTVASHHYFDSVTMQLAELDSSRGVVTICNAGHVFPLRYASGIDRCDVLPIPGHFLNPIFTWESDDREVVRHVELDPGDVLVFLTDGLTGSGLSREPFGYRFDSLVAQPSSDVKSTGEAILKAWSAHYRGMTGDDVALVVVSRRPASSGVPTPSRV